MAEDFNFNYCILPIEVARKIGSSTYLTGRPCKRGGVAERSTGCRACLCNKCLGHYMIKKRRYRKESPKEVSETRRKYYYNNREASLAGRKLYRENNIEKELERAKRYQKENLHIFRANESKKRADRLHRTLDKNCELTRFVMEEASDLCRIHEETHGIKFHVDHMIPMRARKVSGLHVAWNLQVLPAKLNIRKNNRPMYTEPFEWVRDAHMVNR